MSRRPEIYFLQVYIIGLINNTNTFSSQNLDIDNKEKTTLKLLKLFLTMGMWESSYFLLSDLKKSFNPSRYTICKNEIENILKK